MRANYQFKVNPLSAGLFPAENMTDKEKRAWLLTEPYRMQEYEAVANAIIISVLYALATQENDPHGAVRLRRVWETMIRTRANARRELRKQDGEYRLEATGKNVEDYYMREELRKRGADVLEWERHVQMDDDGEIVFTDEGRWRE